MHVSNNVSKVIKVAALEKLKDQLAHSLVLIKPFFLLSYGLYALFFLCVCVCVRKYIVFDSVFKGRFSLIVVFNLIWKFFSSNVP